ncbi:hypothetical protein LTR66_012308 [Elasticomyces elasticus]|nr:hypothetical protein LTR66_012308 [Elasticomyces elasticus]
MKALLTLAFTLALSVVSAAPAPAPAVPSPAQIPFYLVTTSQSHRATSPSSLKNVSATSLFDPYYQPNYLLRLTGPGYLSLSTFTLSNGTLHTTQSGPHGIGTFEYNSTAVVAGSDLQFAPAPQRAGNLALKKGYLLTVDGKEKGWTICAGQLGQAVVFADAVQIEWQGADASCAATYLQAVSTAPY